MRSNVLLACCFGAALTTACSSSAPQIGPPTVTIDGTDYAANSILFGNYQNNEVVDVFISDTPDLCDKLPAGGAVHGVHIVALELKNYGPNLTGLPITDGTYSSTVNLPDQGLAGGGEAGTLTATCDDSSFTQLDGTITVEAFNPSSTLSGMFDLRGGSSYVTGSFNAVYCPKIDGTKSGACN